MPLLIKHSGTMPGMNALRVVLLFTLVCGLVAASQLRAQDSEAPVISDVEVATVTDTSVTIKWKTDEVADSIINYGLKEDYGIVRIPTVDRTEHEIVLDELEPGRTYYFRVVSSDEEGNQGISADYKVVTSGNPVADGSGQADADGQGQGSQAGEGSSSQTTTESTTQTETQTVEEITQQIQEIKDPEQLEEILNETVKAIQGVTEDLTIIGPPTVIVETTSATIKWTTDREADSEVFFSPSESYTVGNFEFSQASTQGPTKDHEIRIIGLEPFTEYTFKVASTDGLGITGESRDFTFKTKASLPEIRNLRILKVQENSATLAWDTTVPAKALIEYQDLTTGVQNSKGRPTYATTNQMEIEGLTLGTRYVAFVIAENAGGDRVKSNPITFITVKDTAPPFISNVTNESTLFPGDEVRIQSIIEWRTDEPAFCTVTYREGVAGGVDPVVVESEDRSFAEKHVEVIIDFAAATVYQFWLNCEDEAGNAVQSENFVLFTPVKEKNIIDIIIENFESSFGWVKNISG